MDITPFRELPFVAAVLRGGVADRGNPAAELPNRPAEPTEFGVKLAVPSASG